MQIPHSLAGRKFGRLSVVSEKGRDSSRYILWECICDCGKTVTVNSTRLVRGHTTSCGCLQLELRQELVKRKTTHGHTVGNANGYPGTAYASWHAMKTRCQASSHPYYKDYGGRGIVICDRWLTFEHFLADMGDRPEGKTLDRIDVNGNYELSNCRWATRSEQSRNRRRGAV